MNRATDHGAAPVDLQAIGPRIVDLRNRLGVTQRALARRAGLQPSRLSKIERSLKLPKLDELIRIAQVLGVGLEWLVYGETPRPGLPVREEITETVSRFVESFRDFLLLLVRLARGGPSREEREK